MLNCNESSWRNGVEMPRNKHKVSSKEGPFGNYCTCRTCQGYIRLAIDPDMRRFCGHCKGCMSVSYLDDHGVEPASWRSCSCRTCHGDLYLAIDVVAGKVYGACKDCKIVTDLEDPGPVMEERINRGEHK